MKERKKALDLCEESLAGDIITDQEHAARLARYSKAKQHQQTVTDYIAGILDLNKEYSSMIGCGEYLIFQHWLQTNFRKLVGGFSCKKHLLCMPCALRRDSRQVREYSLKIKQVLSENPHLVPVLITRTVKNGPDLLERFRHLKGIHKRLIQRRRQSLSKKSGTRGRSANSIMQYIAGSVGTYEFKKGENSGGWHPHIHEVAFLEPVFQYTSEEVPGWRMRDDGQWEQYLKTIHVPVDFSSRLAQEYWQISGDSYIIDVRRIENENLSLLECAELPGCDVNQDNQMVKALCEVFKYALKYNEISVEDQVYAYRKLKGKTLIFSYGNLFGVKLPDNLTDESREELEIGPYVYELYKSYTEGYKYLKTLSNKEYEELQEAAALQGRMENLRRREERLEEGKSVLLENGLRIDREYVDKSGVKSFWKGFSLPRMGHDLECRSAVNDQMLEWQK